MAFVMFTYFSPCSYVHSTFYLSVVYPRCDLTTFAYIIIIIIIIIIVTCRPFLGNNSVQNAFPWRWIPGNQLRYKKGFRVNEQSTSPSMDTATLYKRPFR
jgi:hypothetical protein